MRLMLAIGSAAVLVAAMSAPAHAQSDAPVGVRAAGMAGAFVAVADDASALFWNPAGFASGSYFSLVIDRSELEADSLTFAPRRRSAFLVALGTPPLGMGYYRTTVTTLVDDKTPSSSGQDLVLQHLTAHQTGLTVVQTIAPGISVGAAFKLVHGVAAAVPTNGRAGIQGADDLPGRGSTKFDTDIGLIAASPRLRVGLSVRNALEPSFSPPGDESPIALERRIRGGVAVVLSPSLSVAADADFTKAETSGGQWRDAAVGVESRLMPRVWGRGGIHWNTAGEEGAGAAPVASVGGSVVIRGTLLADAQVSFGSGNGDRGWGLGLRVVY